MFELPGKPYEEPQLQESLERLNWRVSKNLIVELKEAEKPWIKVCSYPSSSMSKIEFPRLFNLEFFEQPDEIWYSGFGPARPVLGRDCMVTFPTDTTWVLTLVVV